MSLGSGVSVKHVYFVSYKYDQGFGMIEVITKRRIKTFEDVLSLKKIIKNKNGLDVVIVNWKKLKK